MAEINVWDVLRSPRITEKGTVLAEQGKYVFEVAPDANKVQVKRAIEEAFAARKINVVAVNVLRVPGKMRRVGRRYGMSRPWKKAVVTLRQGQRLDLFEGV